MAMPSTPSPERAAQGEETASPEQANTATDKTQPQNETANPAGSASPSSSGAAAPAAAAGSDESAAGEAQSEDAAAAQGEGVEPEAESAAIAAAQAEAKEWQDKYLRLHAEWDTYRRRTTEQREAEKARATEKLVSNLLPVIDDFERTIDYAANHGETGLLDGVKAVHAKLVDVLVRDGVEVIDPVGEAFDALEAQAVATVPDDTTFDETVREVYQKGYKMGTKVLRSAMVTVTTGGPKREKPSEEA